MIIISIKWLLLPNGHEVHILYESGMETKPDTTWTDRSEIISVQDYQYSESSDMLILGR